MDHTYAVMVRQVGGMNYVAVREVQSDYFI